MWTPFLNKAWIKRRISKAWVLLERDFIWFCHVDLVRYSPSLQLIKCDQGNESARPITIL